MNIGVEGEFRCVVTDESGFCRLDTGYQKNMLLNQGLDFFGGGHGIKMNKSCAVGGGNSAPSEEQTALDSYIKQVNSILSTKKSDYVDEGDGLYKIQETEKYRFSNMGAVNISEVGLISEGSSSNYYLTTRSLIKDSKGLPTTISIKEGEILEVYYTITKVYSIADVVRVVNLVRDEGNTPYSVTVRPALIGNKYISVSSPVTEGIDKSNINNLRYSSGTLGEVTSGIKGGSLLYSSEQVSTTPDAYVAGSHKIVMSMNMNIDYMNSSDIRVLGEDGVDSKGVYFSFLPFQMSFSSVDGSAPLSKTSKETLKIPFEISWGRVEEEV